MLSLRERFSRFSSMSTEMKIYDAVNGICFIGMLLACFLVHHFLNSRTGLYVSFGVAIMFLATILEANRTGRFTSCAIIMSVTFNFFYMPLTFLIYERFICVIPIYFLFGLIYTALTLDKKKAIILGSIEAIFYEVFLIYYGIKHPFNYMKMSSSEIQLIYSSALAGIVLVSICAAAAVRFRYIMLKNEQDVAKNIHQQALDTYVEKDMFLINMSHEIRTPMNAIIGNVNLMLDEDVDNHVRDNIYNILNSCDALLSTVNELMDLSKTDSHEMEIVNARFDLYGMIMEIINMISVRLMEGTVDFCVEINKSLPRYVVGDSSKIRQLFINILNNAVKFTKDGTIKMVIDCERMAFSDMKLIVCIEDTGIGMNENELEQIRAGFKYDLAGKKTENDNLGIGLRITKEIVKNMNGSISVNSKYGKGTAFDFSVPVVAEYDGDDDRGLSGNQFSVLFYEKNDIYNNRLKNILDKLSVNSFGAKSAREFEQSLRTGNFSHVFISAEKYNELEECINTYAHDEKIVLISEVGGNIEVGLIYATVTRPLHSINVRGVLTDENIYSVHRAINKGDFALMGVNLLVVDDNYTNLDVASAILKKYGADVATASSGMDALRIAGEQKFDMIFLDYMMPEMNGIDTLNALRGLKDSDNSEIPAIALTANVISGAYEMFMEAGFDGFIPKPIDVARLEKYLKELLPDEKVIYRRNV